jgi:hypothetical protein
MAEEARRTSPTAALAENLYPVRSYENMNGIAGKTEHLRHRTIIPLFGGKTAIGATARFLIQSPPSFSPCILTGVPNLEGSKDSESFGIDVSWMRCHGRLA